MTTQTLLIDAMLRLMGQRGSGDVSVRDVAAEAGINHGLVHRHFGSKQALVRAAVERLGEQLHEGARDGLSARSFAFLRGHPGLANAAARACLDGPRDVLELAAPTPAQLERIVAPVRALLARLGLEGVVDAHVVNAFATAAFVGWFVLRPLLEGYGLPKDADEQVARLAAWMDAATA